MEYKDEFIEILQAYIENLGYITTSHIVNSYLTVRIRTSGFDSQGNYGSRYVIIGRGRIGGRNGGYGDKVWVVGWRNAEGSKYYCSSIKLFNINDPECFPGIKDCLEDLGSEPLCGGSMSAKEYVLVEKLAFTVEIGQEWRMPIMEPGDEVKIDGNDVYVRRAGSEQWFLTNDPVSPVILERVKEK